MKTLLLTIILLLSIFQNCFAALDVITAEQESQNAISYIILGHGRTPQMHKYFVKYVNNKNESEYWIKVSTLFSDRLKPFIDIDIDGEKHRIYAFEEYKKRHLNAGTASGDGVYNYNDFECYPLSNSLIQKLSACKNFSMLATSHKRQDMKLPSNEYFLNGIKEIIKLNYDDREKYYTNKEKVQISNPK